ncbi:hypothetical protein DYBT9275_04121 [Dyadobacter sp. CECT 9275]|uniref:FecR family protein n=1 Tax=Dyadobacter helix TaxID=2822344 RepID=A0A916JER2_9BACT|nr:FecR family protein [Dyadobacter sp. CECT 9275]CAG5007766.1 hypothetical protein DYBT9275_04121 [Dyadobacter sp. CECT 9275]
MEEKHYIAFFKKYVRNEHTEQEHDQFLKWLHSLPDAEIEKVMLEYAAISSDNPVIGTIGHEELIQKIESSLDVREGNTNEDILKPRSLWGYLRRFAAAAVLILIGTATYYLFFANLNEPEVISQLPSHDVAPGGNKAVLTLSDGSTINLNDAGQGEIASQSGIRINKVTDGQLVYIGQPARTAGVEPESMNLVRTPKAGQYQVHLSDGTKVWLNSMSSIRFPAVFKGPARKVEITGEAYFEVAGYQVDGKKIPFVVTCNNQLIEVVGTHFNVNSYQDEMAVKTTLLEGSVKVSAIGTGNMKWSETVRLRPGEQSILKPFSGKATPIAVKKADTEGAIAWKQGYFKFKDTDIREVMRQLSRWYDLEVIYKGALPEDQFTGYISKKVSISNVLNILEEGGGVKFNIQANRVEVSAHD